MVGDPGTKSAAPATFRYGQGFTAPVIADTLVSVYSLTTTDGEPLMTPRSRILAIVTLAAALHSGVSEAEELLTLPDALTIALTGNPTIAGESARVERTKLEREIARSERGPKIGLEASYTSYSHPTLVTSIREAGVFPPFDRQIGRLGVVLDLPLYAGGRLVAGEALALHEHDAARHGLASAEQDLLYDVTATYAKALQLKELQRSARARVAALTRERAQLEALHAQGRVAQIDVMRLQTQLSEAKHDLLTLEQGERDARSVLAALLGGLEPLPQLAGLPQTIAELPTTAEATLERALAQRPDLLRVQALADAAADRVRIAQADRRPQVSLLGTAQQSAGRDSDSYDDAQIGVQVTVPVFDGAIRRKRVGQARLEERSSLLELDQTRNRLGAEVEQAHGGVVTSRERLTVSEQREREATESLRVETARYHAGESTISDLLDAEAAYWSAVSTRLQTRYDVLASEARLLHAMGELSPTRFATTSGTSTAVTIESSAGGRGAVR